MDFCVHVKVSAAGMFIGAILVGISFSLKVSKSKTIFHKFFFFFCLSHYIMVFILITYVNQGDGLLLDWVPILAVTGVLVIYTITAANLKSIPIMLQHCSFSFYLVYFVSLKSDLHCIFLDWYGSRPLGDNVRGKC